jgi:hypothetical protein
MESFNFYINSGSGQPSPFKITTPHSLRDVAGLAALDGLGNLARRTVVVNWLQDNIVSLVGPDAADSLGNLLLGETVSRDDAAKFVDQALSFQKLLERGVQTPHEAVEEWHRRQRQKAD